MDTMTLPKKYTLPVLLASATLTVMGGTVIVPVLNLMEEGLGVDPAAVRLIVTTHGIFIAIFSPLMGILIDRVGVRKPFAAGLLLYGLAGSSGMYINNYWLLIVSRMLVGIGIAAVFTSMTVMILNFYKGAARNKVTGWRAASNSVGGILWPLLGGLLGTISWHLPFATYYLVLVLGFLAFVAVPETHGRITPHMDATDGEESVLGIFKKMPLLLAIYLLIFVTNVFLYATIVFLPKLFVQLNVSNPLYIGLTISTMGIASVITSLLYGKVKSKLSYKSLVVVVMAIWVTAFIMMSQAFSLWFVWFSVLIYGIGMGMIMPAIPIWAGEQVSASYRGRITSYLGTFGFVGQFLSPLVLSPVAASLGLGWVFIVTGGIAALILVGFALSLRR
jgi:ACDE family multidrug resistance protein